MQVVTPTPRTQPRIQPRTPPRPSGARWGTLALALAAGLAASLLAFLLLRGRLDARPASAAPVPVVVAVRDVPARTRLTPALLATRRLPPRDVPDGAITEPAQALGKVTTGPISLGMPVTRLAVTEGTAALGMAFALPPSRRAVTVALDPADSAEQFVRPGDRVDILATDEPGSGPAEARTVLQNVALLAVGGQTSPDAPPPPSSGTGPAHVTVSVTPAQAQALVLAAARGKIHLALRAIDDGGVSEMPPLPAPPAARETPRPALPVPKAPLAETVPPPPPIRLPPPPPARVTVLVVKGSQSQTVSVAP